jgi:hypothetical protein
MSNIMQKVITWSIGAALFLSFAPILAAGNDGGNFRVDITQEQIENRDLNLIDIRNAGLNVFTTPFNRLDGLGDGPTDRFDTVSPGGRPTLQNNGMFLRINGLDAQTCLECHSVLSTAVIPAKFAVGGFGGVSASAFPDVIDPDIDASKGNNDFAAIQGRMINPPFVFGSGGVELAGREMTRLLQALKAIAMENPGIPVELVTKGVSFGSISCFAVDSCDTSSVDGIDDDLVVRPFGRKGNFITTRAFDEGAMQFHHGMQPVEVVGEGVDDDGDGVENELTIGQMSALSIWMVTLELPEERGRSLELARGKQIFRAIGCADCHKPTLETESPYLTFSFPEVADDPTANVFYQIDLSKHPGFERAGTGIQVPLYADLKRHDMGEGLEESTDDPLDPFFTTARLWGVADTGPWLHDGRATTLTEAILLHGGEAQVPRDAFAVLSLADRADVIAFLRTLRTPKRVR